ncbi:MAG: hypothetical protein ACOCYE_11895 [Pseudomonadota bacterium]
MQGDDRHRPLHVRPGQPFHGERPGAQDLGWDQIDVLPVDDRSVGRHDGKGVGVGVHVVGAVDGCHQRAGLLIQLEKSGFEPKQFAPRQVDDQIGPVRCVEERHEGHVGNNDRSSNGQKPLRQDGLQSAAPLRLRSHPEP